MSRAAWIVVDTALIAVSVLCVLASTPWWMLPLVIWSFNLGLDVTLWRQGR